MDRDGSNCTAHADDRELALKAAGGDRAAFGAIYARYAQRIHTLLTRRLPEALDRDDLLQDVFLQVYRNLSGFRGRSALYTWIYRIACNVCLQWRRTQRRRLRVMPLEIVPPGVLSKRAGEGVRAPERVGDSRRALAQVLDALRCLPQMERQVMALGPIQGHSYEQIADWLGVSVDVVKGRLHRGRTRLRRELEGPAPAFAG